jgi:hypothetical protein
LTRKTSASSRRGREPAGSRTRRRRGACRLTFMPSITRPSTRRAITVGTDNASSDLTTTSTGHCQESSSAGRSKAQSADRAAYRPGGSQLARLAAARPLNGIQTRRDLGATGRLCEGAGTPAAAPKGLGPAAPPHTIENSGLSGTRRSNPWVSRADQHERADRFRHHRDNARGSRPRDSDAATSVVPGGPRRG